MHPLISASSVALGTGREEMTRNVCSPRPFPFLSLRGDFSCIGRRVGRQADYLTWDLGSHRHIQREECCLQSGIQRLSCQPLP